MQFNIPRMNAKPPSMRTLSINQFKGINIGVTKTQIKDNESPAMLNTVLDDTGALDKRFGQLLVKDFGVGKINGIFEYKYDGTTYYLVAHGTKLYKMTSLSGTATEIFDGLKDDTIRGFYFKENFYILDGIKYRILDGITGVKEVEGYIPTVSISVPPTGGGTLYEQLNMLTPKFKTSFSGDGTAKTFQLPLNDLDSAPVTAEVAGVSKVEGTDFTIDRATGVVTFTDAPPNNPNNTIVIASKTFADYRPKIDKCRIWTTFGGANDTRIFLSGNTDEPSTDYHSGLQDPSYFPANGFADIGGNDTAITNYAKQYSKLIIVKEDSLYLRTEELPEGATEPVYPVKRLNDVVGSSSFDQVQLVENYPMLLDKKGVYMLTNTEILDEKDVKPLSDNINYSRDLSSIKGLLSSNIKDYISADFESKYMLFNKVTGIVWIYDYRFLQWFQWDNFFANCVIVIDGSLYFGESRSGKILKYKIGNDEYPYRDVDKAIKCYWRSKVFNFGSTTHTKYIDKIFYTIKPGKKTSATLKIQTDKQTTLKEVDTTSLKFLSYGAIQYGSWVYAGNVFPSTEAVRSRNKKIGYLQLELSNDNIDESLGILAIDIKHRLQNEYK